MSRWSAPVSRGAGVVRDAVISTMVKRTRIFLGIGAYDGVRLSNTLMLERDLGWTGLYVEPLPNIFAVLQRSRRCICVHARIRNREEAGFEFVAADSGAVHTRMLSDALSEYDPPQLVRVDAELHQVRRTDTPHPRADAPPPPTAA